MKNIPKHLIHSHEPSAIRKRLKETGSQSYVRDFVYGAIDGTVTTFAIVAGVVGASLPTSTIIILGLANIVADGFSMAAGNYLATKSEVDEKSLIKDFELHEIRTNPEGEKAEIKEIFLAKGFDQKMAQAMVDKFSQNESEWLKLMLQEEYGLPVAMRSPLKCALVTFGAFLIFGLIPLLPYIMANNSPFFYAGLLTLLAFFLVGSLKSIWSIEPFYLSGLKTAAIGASAAALAFYAGVFLKNMGFA